MSVAKERSASLAACSDDYANRADLPGAALAEPQILRMFPSIKHALLDYCRENFKTMTRRSLFKHLKNGAIMDAYKSAIRKQKDQERSRGQSGSTKNDRTPTLNEWLSRFGYRGLSLNTVRKWALVYGLRQDEMTGAFYFVGEESEQEVLAQHAKADALFAPKHTANSSYYSEDDHGDSGSEASNVDSDADGDKEEIDGVPDAHMKEKQATQSKDVAASPPRPPTQNYHPLHSPIQQVNAIPPPRAIVHPGPGALTYHDWAYAQHYHYVNPAYGYRPYAYIVQEAEAPRYETEHPKSTTQFHDREDGMI